MNSEGRKPARVDSEQSMEEQNLQIRWSDDDLHSMTGPAAKDGTNSVRYRNSRLGLGIHREFVQSGRCRSRHLPGLNDTHEATEQQTRRCLQVYVSRRRRKRKVYAGFGTYREFVEPGICRSGYLARSNDTHEAISSGA